MPEIGATGTDIFSGYIDVDYNPKLTFPRSIEIYDRMRKGDATVSSTLDIVKLPIINGIYDVKPASDSPEDIEKAEFIKHAFFEEIKWKEFLIGTMLSFDFGFMLFEKVYTLSNKSGSEKIVYKKLAQRLPVSILRWTVDRKNMENPGVEQRVMGDVSPDNKAPKITGEKLFRVTINQEGNNYEGVSFLRTSYQNWWYKDLLYKIEGMAAERGGAGIPTVKQTEEGDIKDEERKKMEKLLKGLRVNQKSHIILPFGWDFMFSTADSKFSFAEPILHHDRQISKNVLAQFIDTGAKGSTGGFAQTKADQELFFLFVLGHISMILEKINGDLVKELIDLNYDNTDEYPKIFASEISKDDIHIMTEAIAKLASAGVDFSDLETQNKFRRSLKLPEITEEQHKESQERKINNPVDPVREDEAKKEKEKEAKAKEKKKKKVKEKLALADEKKKPLQKRETNFVQNITKNEQLISEGFAKVVKDLEKMNVGLEKFIKDKYKKAKFIIKNDEVRLSRKGNEKIITVINKRVDLDYNTFSKKWNSVAFSTKVVEKAFKNGSKAAQKLSDVSWAARGFRFNVRKTLENAPVNIKERVNDHFGTEAVVGVAIAAIHDMVFGAVNNNRMKLSYETYPRSSFKQAVLEDNLESVDFKMVLPEEELKRLLIERPSGFSVANVFRIGTILWWATRRDDDNGNPVIFPIHPNSKDYYLPIIPGTLEEEEERAKEQRAEVREQAKQLSEDLRSTTREISNHYTELKAKFHTHGKRPKNTSEENDLIHTLAKGFLSGDIEESAISALLKLELEKS